MTELQARVRLNPIPNEDSDGGDGEGHDGDDGDEGGWGGDDGGGSGDGDGGRKVGLVVMLIALVWWNLW